MAEGSGGRGRQENHIPKVCGLQWNTEHGSETRCLLKAQINFSLVQFPGN